MATIATLSVKLIADARELNEGLQRASERMKSIGASAMNAGKTLTAGLTLPIAALGAAAVKTASDAEEAGSKFEAVFGEGVASAAARVDELRAIMPAARHEITGMAAEIQDLLVPLGMAPDAASDMTFEIVRLAGDLASFNNIPVAEALERIRSGLVGQNEPLLKFGVALNAAMVETRALEMGLIAEGEALDAASRAQATFALILEGTTAAQGDQERTAGSLANMTKELRASTLDLAVAMGRELIPVVKPLIEFATDLIGRFNNLDQRTRRVIIVVGGLVAAIGPLLVAFGAVVSAAGVVIGVLSGPILVAIAGVVAAVTGLIAIWEVFGEDITRIVRQTYEAVQEAFGRMVDTIRRSAERIREIVDGMIDAVVGTFRRGLDTVKNVVDTVTGGVTGAFQKLSDVLVGNSIIPDMMRDIQFEFVKLEDMAMATPVDNATGDVLSSFKDLAQNLPPEITTVTDAITSIVDAVDEVVGTDIGGILKNITDFFRQFKIDLGTIIPAITGLIKKIGGVFSYSEGGQTFNFGGPFGGGAPPGAGGPTVLPGGGFDSAILFQVTDLAKYAVTRNQLLTDMDAELSAQTALLRKIAQGSDTDRRPVGVSSGRLVTSTLEGVNRELGIEQERDAISLGILT